MSCLPKYTLYIMHVNWIIVSNNSILPFFNSNLLVKIQTKSLFNIHFFSHEYLINIIYSFYISKNRTHKRTSVELSYDII